MRSKDLESAHTPQPAVKPTSLALTLLRTPLRNVPNVTRARIEIEAVTRYWNKEIEFLLTYRARVTNGTSRGLNLRGIKIGRAVRRPADFTSARLVLWRTNEAAVCVT